ncbi:hypothetical protein [Martelella alba]|uniref:Uncharacterized protein n=1 Tax=Martelella alba TaxID=2590451 RepID=A0ABY2SKM6_9HYPH|nr:hypothetical protein [Martelella alba]TKI05528.1 hypothetical protein FCN80_14240 [Martelella alba]
MRRASMVGPPPPQLTDEGKTRNSGYVTMACSLNFQTGIVTVNGREGFALDWDITRNVKFDEPEIVVEQNNGHFNGGKQDGMATFEK